LVWEPKTGHGMERIASLAGGATRGSFNRRASKPVASNIASAGGSVPTLLWPDCKKRHDD